MRTIKQSDYEEFFGLYEKLIENIDDLLGGHMNHPKFTPEWFGEHKVSMKNEMIKSLCDYLTNNLK